MIEKMGALVESGRNAFDEGAADNKEDAVGEVATAGVDGPLGAAARLSGLTG